jgi:hypothetical protein
MCEASSPRFKFKGNCGEATGSYSLARADALGVAQPSVVTLKTLTCGRYLISGRVGAKSIGEVLTITLIDVFPWQ